MNKRTKRALDAAERFLRSIHPHGDDLRALKEEALEAISEARAIDAGEEAEPED